MEGKEQDNYLEELANSRHQYAQERAELIIDDLNSGNPQRVEIARNHIWYAKQGWKRGSGTNGAIITILQAHGIEVELKD